MAKGIPKITIQLLHASGKHGSLQIVDTELVLRDASTGDCSLCLHQLLPLYPYKPLHRVPPYAHGIARCGISCI